MKFNIVTPSYNQLDYLKRAVASVRDQVCDGVAVQHHVQDGGSDDGTVDWLRQYGAEIRGQKSEERGQGRGQGRGGVSPKAYSFSFCSEKDDGMYAALNKGFALANGSESDVCAYLNCDEQYLEGTLGKVAECFRENSETDILFGGFLVVDENGELLSFRKPCPVRRCFIEADYLYNFTCAMFMRRYALDELRAFDPRYRIVGDMDFVLRALRAGFKYATIDEYLAAFTYRKDNLSHSQGCKEEAAMLRRSKRGWPLKLAGPVNFARRVEKVLCGAAREKFPLEYDLYADDISQRTHFVAKSGTPRWPR